MAFIARYRRFACADYPDVALSIWVNPTANEFYRYYETMDTPDACAPLVAAYQGAQVEAYGKVFDFSTSEAAHRTLEDPETPLDLRAWLRWAAAEAALAEQDEIRKNFRAS